MIDPLCTVNSEGFARISSLTVVHWLVPARSATSLKLIGWPDAASSSHARSTAAMSSCSAGIGVGNQGVDALYEAAVTGGFCSPFTLFGVGEERIGVDALKAKDRQEGLI